MSWSIDGCDFDDPDMLYHVIPLNDLKPHEPTITCPCGPCQDEEVPNLYVHNSFDRRELYEGKMH